MSSFLHQVFYFSNVCSSNCLIYDLNYIQRLLLKSFSDNVKVCLPIKDVTEVQLKQEEVDSLTQWFESNFLFINLSKCVLLHYSCKIPPNYMYLLSGANVPSEEMVQDLGIHFDTQLKFDKHVSAILRNANQCLLSLKRSFRKFNLQNFLLLYKSLVCPLPEYTTSVWFSLKVMDEHCIEKLQRRVSRMIPYLQHLPYKE